MTSDLSNFAAQLCEFIAAQEALFREGPISKHGAPSEHYDSRRVRRPALQGDSRFDELARMLFRLQFHRNAAYRKWCEARSVFPDSVAHWTQIPAVPAAAFKELELTCLPPHERKAIFHSSGTTGHRPSRHFHSAESLAVYEASLWPWFRAHVVPDFESQISSLKSPAPAGLALLAPSPVQSPHSSLAHMFEVVRQEMAIPESAFVGTVGPDGSWALDFEAALAALRRAMESRRPLILLGTAFSFVHLLDDLAKRDLRFTLPPGSRVMETGGYKGRSRALPKAELHSLLSRQLGVPATHIVCEYGMSELSSQAYDIEVRSAECQESGRMFQFPPWARIQVISPETGCETSDGEIGLLRIFDLANVFSAMAIQTEDLAIRRGNGFELVGRSEQVEPRGCSLLAVDS